MEKKIEVNLILEMPEACKRCVCDNCADDCEDEFTSKAIGPVVNDAARGFVFLAKNVMGADAAAVVAGRLEYLEMINDGRPALDMLYGMFSAAGMKPLADGIHHLICMGNEDPDICSLFMSIFLDDEEINWYLVENWCAAEFKEVQDGEVQDDCDM